MSNLTTPAAEWLAQLFEFDWCADCGRDHRHHTAIPFMGNWFARCDREPLFNDDGELIADPEGYETKRDCAFCYDEPAPAAFIVPQVGKVSGEFNWGPACACHASDWWDGSDYPNGEGAPAFIAVQP